mmetsp:Transcript_8300/g.14296  ORF Transcript_8300/g.14296 Transcript_8300/m.14296 type:complete len:201 (-) Transcript_8300:237-839(-)
MGSFTCGGCTITSCPDCPPTVTSGWRNDSNAHRTDTLHASRSAPPWSNTWINTLSAQTFRPDKTHNASVSIAPLPFKLRSMTRATSTASSEGRPASNDGEAIGLNSTLKRTEPSFGRSGNGSTSSAVTDESTLVGPSCASHTPSFGPNRTLRRRVSNGRRPSTRCSACNAPTRNSRSFAESRMASRISEGCEALFLYKLF